MDDGKQLFPFSLSRKNEEIGIIIATEGIQVYNRDFDFSYPLLTKKLFLKT